MNKHAIALGKLGGKSRSEKKVKASRENGKKGGRKSTVKLVEWCGYGDKKDGKNCAQCVVRNKN
jgi:hypothetical protein